MRTIWKFPLKLEDKQIITIPGYYRVLHVGLDPSEDLCLWVELDPAGADVEITIYVIGTGHPIPCKSGLYHLGSVTMSPWVWHVFEG